MNEKQLHFSITNVQIGRKLMNTENKMQFKYNVKFDFNSFTARLISVDQWEHWRILITFLEINLKWILQESRSQKMASWFAEHPGFVCMGTFAGVGPHQMSYSANRHSSPLVQTLHWKPGNPCANMTTRLHFGEVIQFCSYMNQVVLLVITTQTLSKKQ